MGMTTLRAVSPSPISAVSPVRSKSLVPIRNAGSNGSGRSKGLSSSFTGCGESHQQQSNGFHHILGGLFHHSSAPSSLSNKKLQSKSSQGSSKSGTSIQSTGSEQPRRRSQSQPAPRGNSARHQPDFHHEIMNDHTALQRKESNSDPKSKNKKVRNSNNSRSPPPSSEVMCQDFEEHMRNLSPSTKGGRTGVGSEGNRTSNVSSTARRSNNKDAGGRSSKSRERVQISQDYEIGDAEKSGSTDSSSQEKRGSSNGGRRGRSSEGDRRRRSDSIRKKKQNHTQGIEEGQDERQLPTRLSEEATPTRSSSLNRYPSFLRRGRSQSASPRQALSTNSLMRSLSPKRFNLSSISGSFPCHHSTSSPEEDAPPNTSYIHSNSAGNSTIQSSLTGNSDPHRFTKSKNRSKSLLRSAMKSLGISGKKKTDVDTATEETYASPFTERSYTKLDIDNPVVKPPTNTNPTMNHQGLWNPSDSILEKVGQLQRIDSYSDEDGTSSRHDDSYATASDNGVDVKEHADENDDTFDYDAAYSCAHPMFQNKMSIDDESGELSYEENQSSTKKKDRTTRSKQRTGWASSIIGRGRTLSLTRVSRSKNETPSLSAPFAFSRPNLLGGRHQKDSSRRQEKLKRSHKTEQRNLSYRSNSVPRNISGPKPSINTSRNSIPRKPTIKRKESSNSRKSDRSSSSNKPKMMSRKCIVCRSRLSKSNFISFMDFDFCVGSCFQCARCRCSLDQLLDSNDNERLNGAQVISNARGSIVQCGACVSAMFGNENMSRPQKYIPQHIAHANEVTAKVPVLHCVLCKGDFSSYKGEVQVVGDINYHSACLRRVKGMKRSNVSAASSGTYALVDEAMTPAEAADKLAEKVVVKLSLANKSDYENLTTAFFVWNNKASSIKQMQANEKEVQMDRFLRNDDSEVDLSLKVHYELDTSALGKPNYNGFFASDDFSTKTSVALPHLKICDEGGSISRRLNAELRWVEQCDANPPKRSEEAVLSIEPFPTESDSTKKVMRQCWSYKQSGVVYEFVFAVPFKSSNHGGLSWEIAEGDELDLMQCRLEVLIDQAEEEVNPDGQNTKSLSSSIGTSAANNMTSSATSTSRCDWEQRADQLLNEEISSRDVCEISPTHHDRERNDNIAVARSDGSAYDSNIPPHPKRTSSVIQDPDRDEITNLSELLSAARSGEQPTIDLPKIIFFHVHKENADAEIGLSLIETNGATMVAEVSKSGLFASKLNEGCVVLAINGHRVRSPRNALRMIKDGDGNISVMASDSPPLLGSYFSVIKKELKPGFSWKESPSDTVKDLGISFEHVDGLVRVRDIDNNGPFSLTTIEVGDICLSIDGVPLTSLNVAVRTLALASGTVSLLTFSQAQFWRNMVELTMDKKYTRYWESNSECSLFGENETYYPIKLVFDPITSLCITSPTIDCKIDLTNCNVIIKRVMDMLIGSIKVHLRPSLNDKNEESSRARSLSVSASGSMRNMSDVYKRALIKLEEMKESGRLTGKDYDDSKHALAAVAIQSTMK